MEDLALSPEKDGPYDSSADEFYEQIEAPKFVDLTDKNPVRVDDRYWFCSRVGCDQKHEEELDSEEIYKNFVLRVMAARSPNVRLQKALSRRGASMAAKAKCPLSAPPKSTRPPASRLALLPSCTASRFDGFKTKGSVQRPDASSTPIGRVKVVGAKYMTTPGNRNIVQKQDQFRSVRNPKREGDFKEGKRRVAKALVFPSPKKPVKLKASLELKTPVRRVCEKLNKLELDEESRKKKLLGFSPKSSPASKSKVFRPWRVDCSGKDRKMKSNAENHTHDIISRISDKVECSDENQVAENLGQTEKHEVSQHAQAAEQPSGSDENQVSGSPGDEQQSAPVLLETVAAEGDDKENESAPDENRSQPRAKTEEPPHSPGRKVPGSEKSCNKILKVTRSTTNPNSGTDAQVQKYIKPKPTNPKPFRLRTDERSILKEAHLEKRVRSVTALQTGKCLGEIVPESDAKRGGETKPACKKITRLKQYKADKEGIKEVPEKPSLAKMPKPPKLIAGAAKTPEKPKSILSSGKLKNITPNRDRITRKPTVSFLIPGEKTPELSSFNKSEKPGKVSSIKSPCRERSQTPTTTQKPGGGSGSVKKPKNSTWRLP